eukprot:Amastigsp_a679383_36.p2 type:complete len:110 gc:universal Amastigsp_a679383_36:478-149(-)
MKPSTVHEIVSPISRMSMYITVAEFMACMGLSDVEPSAAAGRRRSVVARREKRTITLKDVCDARTRADRVVAAAEEHVGASGVMTTSAASNRGGRKSESKHSGNSTELP